MVKASFSRNSKKGAWTAHAKYLSRPGAQQEVAKGLGFDATREEIDMIATVRGWEKCDELMWRFIVSPEDADRLDLRDHVRELVGQMERDLGTRLEWVAIDHHNTDDAHVHLLVRGVRENGRALKMDRSICVRASGCAARRSRRASLGRGLNARCCTRASGLSGASSGPRSTARSSDKADANRVVSYEHFQPRSDGARIRAEQEIDRLQFLSGLGLAQRIDERSWQLSENHERELRGRQQSKDVIKTAPANASATSTGVRASSTRGIAMAENRPYRVAERRTTRALCASSACVLSLARRSSQSTGSTDRARGDGVRLCAVARASAASSARHRAALSAVGLDRVVEALARRAATAAAVGRCARARRSIRWPGLAVLAMGVIASRDTVACRQLPIFMARRAGRTHASRATGSGSERLAATLAPAGGRAQRAAATSGASRRRLSGRVAVAEAHYLRDCGPGHV